MIIKLPFCLRLIQDTCNADIGIKSLPKSTHGKQKIWKGNEVCARTNYSPYNKNRICENIKIILNLLIYLQ